MFYNDNLAGFFSLSNYAPILSAADSELPPGGHLAYLVLPDMNVLEPGLLEFYFES